MATLIAFVEAHPWWVLIALSILWGPVWIFAERRRG